MLGLGIGMTSVAVTRAGSAPQPELILIDRTAGTNIGSLTGGGGLAAAFDGNTDQAAAACAQSTATAGYVGKHWDDPVVIGGAMVFGSNNQGFANNPGAEVTIDLYSKLDDIPANGTNGTIIGSITFLDTVDESGGRWIDSTDLVNLGHNGWARIATAGSSGKRIAELVFYKWGVV